MTSRDDWMARCQAVLKGRELDSKAVLQGRLAGPGAQRKAHAPWRVLQRVDHADDLSKAEAQAADDLAQGADGLVLTSSAVAPALTSLPLHKTILRNEAGDEGAESLRKLIADQPLDPARLSIDFGIQDAALARFVHGDGFVTPLMKADGTMLHVEGADDATELGCILAEALGRFRMLDFLDDDTLSRAVSVKLIATQDVFGTIAKFRAMRILWNELLSATGLPAAPLSLHGESSRLMLAEIDAHTNILRLAASGFAAGLGGADSICLLPHSFNQGLANSFARRVARNVHLLLLHESHLWRVADPASGAGAIERKTQTLCDAAWVVMQRCERGEWPASEPTQSQAKPIIGVSKYVSTVTAVADIEGVA